jgi:hypothetical protein
MLVSLGDFILVFGVLVLQVWHAVLCWLFITGTCCPHTNTFQRTPDNTHFFASFSSMLITWVVNAFFDSFGNNNPWGAPDISGEEAVEYL